MLVHKPETQDFVAYVKISNSIAKIPIYWEAPYFFYHALNILNQIKYLNLFSIKNINDNKEWKV